MLRKELLEILCCPKCKGDLLYDQAGNTLTCKKCGTVYRVKNDIPIMVVNNDN
jgi:hypothetical protein